MPPSCVSVWRMPTVPRTLGNRSTLRSPSATCRSASDPYGAGCRLPPDPVEFQSKRPRLHGTVQHRHRPHHAPDDLGCHQRGTGSPAVELPFLRRLCPRRHRRIPCRRTGWSLYRLSGAGVTPPLRSFRSFRSF